MLGTAGDLSSSGISLVCLDRQMVVRSGDFFFSIGLLSFSFLLEIPPVRDDSHSCN